MALFHQIDDAFVILYSRGVYKQAKVYQRDGDLYAGHGSGFVRLSTSGTSVPHISWSDLQGVPRPIPDRLGRLTIARVAHVEAVAVK